MIQSFEAIVNENTQILILGTIPGVASLKKQQYYGNPRNNFWKIIYAHFDITTEPIEYKDKISVLQSKNIGLWDVLKNCDRQGSLDIAIKNQTENDFHTLFQLYTKISTLLFNGKESHRYFYKKYGQLEGITYYVMPSTSPANTMRFETKLALWSSGLK
ncbi:DNA-deoxyinosine glycosylase [Flavobacterium sp.]|uniref:DNA-deoxyinosine glycosylase n=1 Tax=Flavobacterium sp. TaxID=239 RepID=UPI0026083656|nr:DNA-deoxyinosine glycosylase [Flavobacterium sp.]MDG2432667.1 DNA-deoxyinosine glycosylase [Flavobacterium sp.]